MHAVQSTIQWEIGVAVVKIGFAIGRQGEHARRQHVVLLLTLYVLSGGRKWSTISTVCMCESRCLSFCWEIFLVCESTAKQALAQARPIDALHLTSSYYTPVRDVLDLLHEACISYSG